MSLPACSHMALTPFDSFQYLNSFSEKLIATVDRLSSQQFWFGRRVISGTSLVDGLGPHPYSFTFGTLEPERAYKELHRKGLVSFFTALSPDFQPSDAWELAGWKLVPLKSHYSHNPCLPLNALSPKTYRNIRMAQKHWQIERVDLLEYSQEVFETHTLMLGGKQVLNLTNYDQSCFEGWARTPNIETYAARDKEGFGVWAIGGRIYKNGQSEFHLIAIAAQPRAYKTGGFYAIYHYLLNELGRDTTLFFGSTPQGNEGLARFKSRFSNSSRNVWGVQAVFQPEVCVELQQRFGSFKWFPPYRDPFENC
jgi:hypothetical protein